MENEPLVGPVNRMNYTEDGSSILKSSESRDMMTNLSSPPGPPRSNEEDKEGSGTVLERFHEDALQQVNNKLAKIEPTSRKAYL